MSLLIQIKGNEKLVCRVILKILEILAAITLCFKSIIIPSLVKSVLEFQDNG